jgi:hypothetical protein
VANPMATPTPAPMAIFSGDPQNTLHKKISRFQKITIFQPSKFSTNL